MSLIELRGASFIFYYNYILHHILKLNTLVDEFTWNINRQFILTVICSSLECCSSSSFPFAHLYVNCWNPSTGLFLFFDSTLIYLLQRLLGIQMSTFRLYLVCRWSCDDFEVYKEGLMHLGADGTLFAWSYQPCLSAMIQCFYLTTK